MIKTAVLGYGNIGSGVVSVLLNNKDVISAQIGEEIVPVYALDLRDFPGDVMEDKVVKDINLIVNDPEITIVVETMGGTRPAYDFVKACLLAGKHVATSNKELVAAYGAELLQIAENQGVNFLFEASVGGGIPIIRPLSTCITSDAVKEITGILNGTTNFMLTAMAEEGYAYDEILKKAQELGFAERNPAADVEGHDACRKIAILSSLAFGKQVDYRDVSTEGITSITAADMVYAKHMGRAIKLFGTSRKENGKVFARVSPVMIGKKHPLFSVNGVMNAVLVRGDMIGDLMFYGAGAGKYPTATAVVADVVAAVKYPHGGEVRKYSAEKLAIADAKEEACTWFIRVKKENQNKAEGCFGISERIDAGFEDEVGMLTAPISEKQLFKKAEECPLLAYIRLAE